MAGKKKTDRKGILKFPKPATPVERIQAEFTAAGVPLDVVKVDGIEIKKGEYAILTLEMPDDKADEMIKAMSVKLHDPNGPPDWKWLSEEDEPALKKKWASTERKRRSKPKGDDIPDL